MAEKPEPPYLMPYQERILELFKASRDSLIESPFVVSINGNRQGNKSRQAHHALDTYVRAVAPTFIFVDDPLEPLSPVASMMDSADTNPQEALQKILKKAKCHL